MVDVLLVKLSLTVRLDKQRRVLLCEVVAHLTAIRPVDINFTEIPSIIWIRL